MSEARVPSPVQIPWSTFVNEVEGVEGHALTTKQANRVVAKAMTWLHRNQPEVWRALRKRYPVLSTAQIDSRTDDETALTSATSGEDATAVLLQLHQDWLATAYTEVG